MSKHIQLTIADPCHENWEQMSRAEQGRFCAACQKQVIDFTRMGDSQLAAFFKKPSAGSVCGRFYHNQLERDIEIPKKHIPWVKYFFQFVLPAFLFSIKATAQGNVRVKKTNVVVTPPAKRPASLIVSPEKDMAGRIEKTIVQGKIIDENYNPVFNADITIKGSGLGVYTDSSGIFRIEKVLAQEDFILEILAMGYGSKEVPVKRDTDLKKDLLIQLTSAPVSAESGLSSKAPEDLGLITILGDLSVSRRTAKSKRITAKSNKMHSMTEKTEVVPLVKPHLETLPMIKVYPNPVISGTNVNIGCQKLEEGYYNVQLAAQSGQQVFSRQTWIDDEMQVLNIEIPLVTPGVYFLKLTNKETNKRFTEKIIIE